MTEPLSFISVANLERLLKKLVSIRGERAAELTRIGDVFGDPEQLARFYVEPRCQHHNPADRHEDLEPVSQVRAPAFEVINEFLRGDFTPLGDGRTQMFILSDAGMGKTSLLMMIRLMHLMAFWPRGYDCLLLKVGEDTLKTIDAHKDKTHTVLLLDALDEDPLAWGAIESRLVALLDATSKFRRVIISCRTQFFPEAGADAFGRPGRVEIGGYTCPMLFLSLFDEAQVDAYLRKRFPDCWYQRLLAHLDAFARKRFPDHWPQATLVKGNPERLRAAQVVGSMQSLRFRPLLLAHIRDILDAGEKDWDAYSLYQALVDRWLDREERKLRKQLPGPLSKETLWRVCTAVALHMQSQGSRLLKRDDLDQLTAGFPQIASLENFDVGGRSLLNRNAAGAFRFSHYSIQEFLVVHALSSDAAELPLRVTAQMLEFLALLPRMPAIDHLDLRGLQPDNLAGFSFHDRLADGALGPQMQLIPPGTFVMGSPDHDPGAGNSEKPQYQVTIAQTFALGRYPVTFEDYDRFAAATGRKKPDESGWGRRRRPVINVSWDDAVAYCDWLSEQTSRRYRLPTEVEWEYAARAGTETRWSFGDNGGDLDAYGWYDGNAGGQARPVGKKLPNPWGLHDMHGNVHEWVQDAWHDSYQGAPADGSAWESEAGADRVIRGGSWGSNARFCRSADRDYRRPGSRNTDLGFRCARVQA
jgi:formylglycine-generating enzyme required for sulfatase activity